MQCECVVVVVCKVSRSAWLISNVSWMHHLPQEVLRSQVPAQASLQVLQELGEQLKQQVDTSAASAIQSDHVSLTGRLVAVEQALTRQLTTLQVDREKAPPQTALIATFSDLMLANRPALRSQTGVQDYEVFNGQLDSLGRWIVEAEGALKTPDPNGSTDLALVQDRMEELKVGFCFIRFKFIS